MRQTSGLFSRIWQWSVYFVFCWQRKETLQSNQTQTVFILSVTKDCRSLLRESCSPWVKFSGLKVVCVALGFFVCVCVCVCVCGWGGCTLWSINIFTGSQGVLRPERVEMKSWTKLDKKSYKENMLHVPHHAMMEVMMSNTQTEFCKTGGGYLGNLFCFIPWKNTNQCGHKQHLLHQHSLLFSNSGAWQIQDLRGPYWCA